jgi:small GTP-binding protein
LTQSPSPQETHLKQAQTSIQQAVNWYASVRRHWNYPPNVQLQAAVRQDIQNLKAALEKIEQQVIKIATFGLVSRGKSAVVNALLGQKVLETGPLHGVTQWPKSIRWTANEKVQIELIDTPGLDEIAGEARANMAKEVADQADLILFIVAGDITRTEYDALCELKQSHKPLILVFNKIDLYPEQDRKTIYQQLQQLGKNARKLPILSADDIICVAAEPQPIAVRVEYSDRISEEWETPPPQIEALRQKILTILNQEGRSLLAINALFQAKEAQENISQKTVTIRQEEADAIIWKYAQYKALAIAMNPIAVLDIAGGLVTDLFLIRSLARLYGLPITSFEAGKLWQKILLSSGGLLLSELGSSLILGIGKTAAVFESPGALTTYASTAFLQGGVAGYSTYIVGKAAKQYLANGCSWGPWGASTVIDNILSEVHGNTFIYRLFQSGKAESPLSQSGQQSK